MANVDNAGMNELLTRCYEILAIDERASREDILRAFETLKELYEEEASEKPGGDTQEAWERTKEIAWARDTLLRHLSEKESISAPEKGREGLASKSTPHHDKPLPPLTTEGKEGSGKPWWLSSIAVAATALILLALLYHHQSTRPSKGTAPNGVSAIENRNPTAPSSVDRKSAAIESDGLVALPQLLEDAKRAVVTLQFGKLLGSGFLVSGDGYIVTNAHVVAGTRGTAQFSMGEPIEVSLIKMEPEKDFALLKAASGSDHSFLSLGDSDACREGDTVIAIGSPYNLQLSFTKGIVSAKHRRDPRLAVSLIQTDAAINHGNSGGPLLNQMGQVIGINTETLRKDLAEGLNFAIAINDVKDLIKEGQALSEADRSQEASRLETKLQQQQRIAEERAQEMKDRTARAREQEDARYKEQLDAVKERLEKARKRQALQTCFVEVDKKVEELWNDKCTYLSQPNRCRLPKDVANSLYGTYLEGQSDCIKYYGE